MLRTKAFFRLHEWLADRVSFIQYPKPRAYPIGAPTWTLARRWRNRPSMPWPAAVIPPPLMLFVPGGVYLAIAYIAFLFIYCRRPR
ncbi:hypothetical protein R11007_02901 [Ralstonia holmesii]|nr:hypothetical protein R11007_02901 [Ralstonia sp. LMG 32967]